MKPHRFCNDQVSVTGDITGVKGEWRAGFSKKKAQSLQNPGFTKQSTPTGRNTSTPGWGAKALPAPSPPRGRS